MVRQDYLADLTSRLVGLNTSTGRYFAIPRPVDAPENWLEQLRVSLERAQSTVTDFTLELSRAPEPGGMSDAGWWPHLSELFDASHPQLAYKAMPSALRRLRKTRRILATGFGTLIDDLATHRERLAARKDIAVDSGRTRSTISSLSKLLVTHMWARVLYPHRYECLVGSAALALHAWEKGIPVTFTIGVQGEPFYAHAWVSYDDIVVNDGPDCARKLAPVLTIG